MTSGSNHLNPTPLSLVFPFTRVTSLCIFERNSGLSSGNMSLHSSLVPVVFLPHQASLTLFPHIYISLSCCKLTTSLWFKEAMASWCARTGGSESEDVDWWEGCLSAVEVLPMATMGHVWGSTTEQWWNAVSSHPHHRLWVPINSCQSPRHNSTLI